MSTLSVWLVEPQTGMMLVVMAFTRVICRLFADLVTLLWLLLRPRRSLAALNNIQIRAS